jgi:hypothetical protein
MAELSSARSMVAFLTKAPLNTGAATFRSEQFKTRTQLNLQSTT